MDNKGNSGYEAELSSDILDSIIGGKKNKNKIKTGDNSLKQIINTNGQKVNNINQTGNSSGGGTTIAINGVNGQTINIGPMNQTDRD